MRRVERETVLQAVRERFDLLAPFLPEQLRRLWVASEALAIGRGGVALVAEATGVARATILRGQDDLSQPDSPSFPRQRRPGLDGNL